MSRERGVALAIAYLLGPTTDLDRHMEYVCGTLDTMLEDFSDERKADLYAMLAEQYQPMAPLTERIALVQRLLVLNRTPGSLLL